MAQTSTFPAADLPTRRGAILDVVKRHHPVPVATTLLYLSIDDKRHLADEFQALVDEGALELVALEPGHADFDEANERAGIDARARAATLRAYRLGADAA